MEFFVFRGSSPTSLFASTPFDASKAFQPFDACCAPRVLDSSRPLRSFPSIDWGVLIYDEFVLVDEEIVADEVDEVDGANFDRNTVFQDSSL